jgi:hypothetical protein
MRKKPDMQRKGSNGPDKGWQGSNSENCTKLNTDEMKDKNNKWRILKGGMK